MSPGVTTLLMFGGMLLLLLTGLPIAFCLGGMAILFSILLWGPVSLTIVGYSLVNVQNMYSLACLPGFVLTGVILEYSGIGEEMFDVAAKWFGGMRGGLAIGVVLICTVMAAIVGVSSAATVTMGMIALPAMLRRGYDIEMSAGVIQAGGALGLLIPPSVNFVVYGLMADQPIGKLFAGGLVPGLMLAAFYVAYIAIRCRLQPRLGPALPPEERSNWKERFVCLKVLVWPLFLVIVVLGFIMLGITSVTEASGVGALGAVLVTIIHKRFSWKIITQACDLTMRVSGMVGWVLICALTFASIYSGLGAIDVVKNLLASSGLSPMGVIWIMLGTWIILGCFIDPISMLFVTGPLYIPIVASLHLSLLWFGVLYVITVEMAVLTPPFGVNLFYMMGIVKAPGFPFKVTLIDLYKSIIPFVGLQMLGLVLVVYFPFIALWLPQSLGISM